MPDSADDIYDGYIEKAECIAHKLRRPLSDNLKRIFKVVADVKANTGRSLSYDEALDILRKSEADTFSNAVKRDNA